MSAIRPTADEGSMKLSQSGFADTDKCLYPARRQATGRDRAYYALARKSPGSGAKPSRPQLAKIRPNQRDKLRRPIR